jgi:hypothetical protein
MYLLEEVMTRFVGVIWGFVLSFLLKKKLFCFCIEAPLEDVKELFMFDVVLVIVLWSYMFVFWYVGLICFDDLTVFMILGVDRFISL